MPARRLACMARALSVDLRRRVVGAIEGGLSYRAAAERFGVSPSSAIRWRAQEQREGDVTPKRQGGDRHSHGIEAHAELCLVPSFDGNSCRVIRRMRYGTGSTRERHDDRGGPSSDTA